MSYINIGNFIIRDFDDYVHLRHKDGSDILTLDVVANTLHFEKAARSYIVPVYIMNEILKRSRNK